MKVLLMLLVACSVPPASREMKRPTCGWGALPRKVALVDGSAATHASVDGAMDAWNDATGRGMFRWAVPGERPDVLVASGLLPPGWAGFTETACVRGEATSAVMLAPGMDVVEAGAVATHELGHVLGVSHSGSRASIMYPTVDASLMGPDWGWSPEYNEWAASDRPEFQFVTDTDAAVASALHP